MMERTETEKRLIEALRMTLVALVEMGHSDQPLEKEKPGSTCFACGQPLNQEVSVATKLLIELDDMKNRPLVGED